MTKQQILPRTRLGLLVFLGFTLLAAPVTAQVFDSGPSDPALFDTVINLPPDPDIEDSASIGGDDTTTQLNIFDEGEIGDDFAALSGSEVNIGGGFVGSNFDAHSGSEVNISGGFVRNGFSALSGSEVNISGGFPGNFLEAASGSVVNISGGAVLGFFDARDGSTVDFSGGSVGALRAFPGSDVELIGGEFQFNGETFSGSKISLDPGDIFSGTLADGSAFIFTDEGSFVNDVLTNVTVTSVELPALDLSPIVVSTVLPIRPSGVRAGQTLTLVDGGSLFANFVAVDATLNIEGGQMGREGGAVGSIVNISGGFVGNAFEASSGSIVNISGGQVGGQFQANSGSTVNISGGIVGSRFEANSGSIVNITGGDVRSRFQANSGGTVNIYGSNFVLDSLSLDELLTPGEAFTIFDRGEVNLSGLLADGSEFSFGLNSNEFLNSGFDDFWDPNATLTVTLVPPAPEIILGDCDQDGDVDFFDINPFIGLLSSGTFLAQADINQDGEVTFLDIAPFIAILAT